MAEFTLLHLDSSFLSLLPSEVTLFLKKHFFPSSLGQIMKAGALIPVWSPHSQGNFTSRVGEIGIPSSPLSNFGIKRSFCASALNDKARPPGFLFFCSSTQQSASGPERRGHLCLCVWNESSLLAPGNLWAPAAGKVRIDFLHPPTNQNVTSKVPRI